MGVEGGERRGLSKPSFIKTAGIITWLFLQTANGQYQAGNPIGFLICQQNTAQHWEAARREEDFKWKEETLQNWRTRGGGLACLRQHKMNLVLYSGMPGNYKLWGWKRIFELALPLKALWWLNHHHVTPKPQSQQLQGQAATASGGSLFQQPFTWSTNIN